MAEGREKRRKGEREKGRIFSFSFLVSILLALALLSCVSAVRAETISGYRAKIHNAKILTDNLIYGDDDAEDGKKNVERETLKSLRLALPPSERVEAKSVSVETQNKWFAEKLDAYEKEIDRAKRRQILIEVSERLGALEAKINELEKAESSVRTKDEDKRKLAEILSREEYRKPEPPQENIIQRTWRRFKEWLDSKFPRTSPFSIPEGGLSSLSFLLQILVYLLVLGGIGFVLYKFVPLLSRKFGRSKKETKSERVVLGETLAADADSHTLFAEAENLAREGKLRAAIRKGYIALLCDLSDRKIIGLAKNKTNRDYLRDVRPRTEIFDDMKNLTTNFERNWYGFGTPEEKDWTDFRDKYRQVIKN